jgi:hypothetical protein
MPSGACWSIACLSASYKLSYWLTQYASSWDYLILPHSSFPWHYHTCLADSGTHTSWTCVSQPWFPPKHPSFHPTHSYCMLPDKMLMCSSIACHSWPPSPPPPQSTLPSITGSIFFVYLQYWQASLMYYIVHSFHVLKFPSTRVQMGL